MNIDTMVVKKLADDILNCQYLMSSDGSRILYQTNSAVYMINADGSNQTVLFDNADHSGFQWSPDGSKIAYLNEIDGTDWYDLYVMKSDGSNKRLLTSYTDGSGVKLYHWSPDSGRIYYLRSDVRDSLTVSDIYVTNTDRTYFVKLTNNYDHEGYSSGILIRDFYLSPDGEKIAYLLSRGSTFASADVSDYRSMRLEVMNADGTMANYLTQTSSVNIQRPLWSPDSSKLFFVVNRKQ